MKNTTLLLIILFHLLQASQCGKSNPYNNPNNPTVKLSVTINKTNETIQLGDTLKLTLLVPDTIVELSKINGTMNKVFISSLQSCFWTFTFYKIDTVNKIGDKIMDASNCFVNPGTGSLSSSLINTNSANKPYTATLNIIPNSKGIFYVEFGQQETAIRYNNTQFAGLRVNMNVVNKHWTLLDPFFTGFSNSTLQRDALGYGWYCFRVN